MKKNTDIKDITKKKFSIRLSLVFLITSLILVTAITLLSISAAFYRNSINWVLEVLSQKVTDHIIDKISSNVEPQHEVENAKEALRKIEISPNGKILLLDDDYNIIASAERRNGDLIAPRFENRDMNMSDVKDPLIIRSFEKFSGNEAKKNRLLFKRKFDHFPFWYDWRKYVAIYKPFEVIGGKEWVVAIIFPYRDFFSSMTRNNIIMYSVALMFVLLAIYVSMQVSKKISQPLTKLATETDKIRNFDLDSSYHISSPLEEVENMSKAVDNMRSGLRSFKKYVPSELVRELIHLNKEATLEGEKKNLTVFFSDIAGFTSISEKLLPEQLVEFLGEYLGEMTKIIIDHKGTVDKYIGDAVMAFWGAPGQLEDHALWACKASLAYQERLQQLGQKWIKEGKPDFFSRIGVNTGDIIVGNMGYEERMNYTVIGDPVNLASRLEALNKNYGTKIMIGEKTHEQVASQMEVRFLDIVAVKGKEKGIKVFELLAPKGGLSQLQQEHKQLYERSLQLYLDRQFEAAKKGFKESLQLRVDDRASKVFVARCNEFITNPPPENWQGVFVAQSK